MILCDIGNTTFHFSVNGKSYKYLLNEDIPAFEQKVYFISVNERATAKLKLKCEEIVNLEPYVKFKTKYKGMGIDRKIACYFTENAIIIGAGSAITIDVIKKGGHKGGFILPGIYSTLKQYSKISHKLLHDFNPKVSLDKIPLCTQDAISFGLLKSIIEPIKKIRKKQKIIFTGGDGKFLSQFFDYSVHKENLIFENMKGIINANNCIA